MTMHYTVNMARRPELLLVIAFLLVLSACVRLYLLGDANYWLDEMVSLHFAKHENWRSIFWDNNPPLYHLLLKLWVKCFGDDELTTRTLSVLFSVGTTGVMMRLGHQLKGRLGATIFGFLHALSILSFLYARETRMYAMFEFFTALNLIYFLRLVKGESPLGGYAFSSILMAASHYLAVVPLAVQAGALVFKRARAGSGVRTLLTLGVLGVALLVLVVSYANFFKWGALGWQNYKFELEPESRWPWGVIACLFNFSWLYAAGTLSALAIAVRFDWVEKPAANAERLLLAIMIIVPLMVMFTAGALAERSVALTRYWIYLVPPMITLLGGAMARVAEEALARAGGQRRLAASGLAMLFCLVLGGTIESSADAYLNKKEPWKAAANMISYYPNSLVLTSRTLAIRTPYFEKHGIEVMSWNPRTPESEALLAKEIAARKHVWVVENYYGGYYLPDLAKSARDRYKVTDLTVNVGESAPVRVLLLEEKEKEKEKPKRGRRKK